MTPCFLVHLVYFTITSDVYYVWCGCQIYHCKSSNLFPCLFVALKLCEEQFVALILERQTPVWL